LTLLVVHFRTPSISSGDTGQVKGHCVNVKVTGTKMGQNSYSHIRNTRGVQKDLQLDTLSNKLIIFYCWLKKCNP